MTPELDRHLRSFANFPSPPGVATRLIELAQDPGLDLDKVAATIAMDPALATKVLRIANSPLYAQRRRSENLRQALIVLGLNATLALSLSFSLVKSLRGAKPNGVNHPLYWRRSLLCGVAARSLGEATGLAFLEELFLAGLIQDIGILALDRAQPDLYLGCSDLQKQHRELAAHERRRFGHDHAEVGAWLLQRWNLPRRLIDAVAQSHRLDIRRCLDAGDSFNRCVALSGALADVFLLPGDERPCIEVAQQIERVFDLDRERFAGILDRISATLPDTESVFETDLVDDPVGIVEQAREILMLRHVQGLRDLADLRHEVATLTQRATAQDERIVRDAESGAYNRAHLEHVLAELFESAQRESAPLSVAVCEIDDFQRARDRLGPHADGQVLRATADLIHGCVRRMDTVGRLDAEEFAVLLPLADERAAREVCERIVLASQTSRPRINGESMSITMSVGCATHAPGHPFAGAEALYAAARQALSTAKLQGANRMVAYEPGGPAPRVYFL